MSKPEPELDRATLDKLSALHELAQIVREMRKAQRAYEILRGAGAKSDRALIEAKRLEAAVDVRLGLLGYR